MDTDRILELLKATAEEVITPRFRALADHEIETKADPTDFVTIADKEAEDYLTRRLRDLYPEAVVAGEETMLNNLESRKKLLNADHAFIIDPIDGTRNFVRGRIEHGIMLAETRAGVCTRGWIWQPQTERAYVVERGAGVEMNGKPIERQQHDRPPLGASSKRNLHGYAASGELSPVVSSNFACAFDYPAILHGDIDFMFYSSLHPWDHLAGSLMVVESGGVSRTLDGVEYTVMTRSRGLLVASDVLVWMKARQHWPVAAGTSSLLESG